MEEDRQAIRLWWRYAEQQGTERAARIALRSEIRLLPRYAIVGSAEGIRDLRADDGVWTRCHVRFGFEGRRQSGFVSEGTQPRARKVRLLRAAPALDALLEGRA